MSAADDAMTGILIAYKDALKPLQAIDERIRQRVKENPKLKQWYEERGYVFNDKTTGVTKL